MIADRKKYIFAERVFLGFALFLGFGASVLIGFLSDMLCGNAPEVATPEMYGLTLFSIAFYGGSFVYAGRFWLKKRDHRIRYDLMKELESKEESE